MRTINSRNGQQVIRTASKLVDDFIELSRALFTFCCPVKVKSPVVIADNQVVNPSNLDKPIKDGHCTGTISDVLKAWHEMESWDLMASVMKEQQQKRKVSGN